VPARGVNVKGSEKGNARRTGVRGRDLGFIEFRRCRCQREAEGCVQEMWVSGRGGRCAGDVGVRKREMGVCWRCGFQEEGKAVCRGCKCQVEGDGGVRKKDKVVCTRCDCQEEKEGGVQEFWVSERGRREACTRCGWASVRFLGKAPKSRFDACWIKLYTDIIIPPLLANYRGRCSHPSFCPNTSELVGGGGWG
jgi:hypothetical protein